MENGSPSPRADAFPAGLRVLVVDDDPTWLKILEKMLKKCSYEVTTCCLARVALDMLRERKDRFDIVISDVNMPDMDGFKLLEQVGLEMDLPVIMMSVDGEISRVMRGVQHGACDYLLKPVRMKELRNIWQHVLRRKMQESKDLESHGSYDDMQILKSGLDEFDAVHLVSDLNTLRKRKDTEKEEHDELDFSDPGAAKKARVVWSVDLHQKFVDAVKQIGFDKVGPKKILDMMNIPGLTRENVASHLQKYRLYLSRLPKQNEPCGTEQSDFGSMDPPAKFGIQNSMTTNQHNSTNSYGYSGKKNCVQDTRRGIHEDELKGVVSFLQVTDTKNSFTGAALEVKNIPSIGPEYISRSQAWSGEISPCPESTYLHLKGSYSNPQMPGKPYQIHVDQQGTPSSIDARTYTTDRDKMGPSQIKPGYSDYIINHVTSVSPKASEVNSFPVQLEQVSASRKFPSSKSHVTRRNDFSIWESPQNVALQNEPILLSRNEDVQFGTLQGSGCFESIGLNNMEILDYYYYSPVAEPPMQIYDGLRSGYDNPWDIVEYPIIDEGASSGSFHKQN